MVLELIVINDMTNEFELEFKARNAFKFSIQILKIIIIIYLFKNIFIDMT